MTLDELFDRAVVAELELPPPHVVPAGASVASTIAAMRARKSAVVLIADANRVVGLFTEVDYVRRIVGEDVDPDAAIAGFMTTAPATVQRSTPLSHCLRLMSEGDFRHLPVVDDAGSPTHLLAVRHLTQYLAERYPSAILAMAPNVHQIIQADGG